MTRWCFSISYNEVRLEGAMVSMLLPWQWTAYLYFTVSTDQVNNKLFTIKFPELLTSKAYCMNLFERTICLTLLALPAKLLCINWVQIRLSFSQFISLSTANIP